MKFLLKYLNPALALFVLVLCILAASMDKGQFNLFGIVDGSFGTYFFAKGVFCCATLFLAGRSLLARWEAHPSDFAAYSTRDLGLVALIFASLIGAFVGLHAKHSGTGKVDPETVTETIVSPKGVAVQPLVRVNSAEHLTVSTQITNASETKWKSIDVRAEVFIGGLYSGEISASDTGVQPNEKRNLLLKSSDLLTKEIRDSVTFKVVVSGDLCRVCGDAR